MKKEGKFYCDCCGKEFISPEDEFMVKDEIWKEGVRVLGLPEKSHVCTDCFREYALGRDLALEDLKLVTENVSGQVVEIELPMNYWIIKREAIKNPWKIMRERKEYIRPKLAWPIRTKQETVDLLKFIEKLM